MKTAHPEIWALQREVLHEFQKRLSGGPAMAERFQARMNDSEKSARGPLRGFWIFRPVHPLQIVVLILFGSLIGLALCKLLERLGI